MQQFAEFVLALINSADYPKKHRDLADHAIVSSQPTHPGSTSCEQSIIVILLAVRDFRSEFDGDCLLRLRNLLIEIAVHYVSKRTKTSVTPFSMMKYMHGSNRRFNEMVFLLNMYRHSIFTDSNLRLKAA